MTGPEPDIAPYETAAPPALETEQMGGIRAKAGIGLLSTLLTFFCLNREAQAKCPGAFVRQEEHKEVADCIATSKSWVGRTYCRWLGHRGLHSQHQSIAGAPDQDWQRAPLDRKDRPEDWSDEKRVLRDIPQYVLDYAPLVHLYSGEQFWPCDIAEHLHHITPALNYTPLQSVTKHPTLRNLDKLNDFDDGHGRWVYLTSNDDVEERPDWLEGEKNIPTVPSNANDKFEEKEGWVHKPGRTYLQGLNEAAAYSKDQIQPNGRGHEDDDDFQESSHGGSTGTQPMQHVLQGSQRSVTDQEAPPSIRGGRSDAPAVLIAVDKGHGIVDAFWFFFYSFNLGNVVLNVRFGNHVGDWEHTAIRFHHGKPKAVFFSEHNFGSAYSYDAVEKLGKRPVIYSAYGTHAMYSTPGTHPYILPWGILHDVTDRGPLWDPALNSHAYTYDFKADVLRASNITPSAPTEWFHFAGRWGDKHYPLDDRRQYRFAGQYHYVSGPYGPKFKNLGRGKICSGPETAPCVIKNWLLGDSRIERLHLPNGDGEDEF
ncbi:Vacuolar protein sorting-associated protein 62 [Exophiala dermatitidis]|nr:Vacuolar protein sorting-associated protein 62 [Exophiala dermatitidis]KAJ4551322.1 Vacuolar protein sorting-associated protein 62 [Exophiala dermatitidis]